MYRITGRNFQKNIEFLGFRIEIEVTAVEFYSVLPINNVALRDAPPVGVSYISFTELHHLQRTTFLTGIH